MANEKKGTAFQKFLPVVTLILSVGFLLSFFCTTDGAETLKHVLRTLCPQWAAAAVLAVAAGWFLEGWSLNILCRHLNSGWRYGRSFLTGMTGLFYGAVSPCGAVSQPMQIYMMSRMGMDAGTAGSVVVVRSLVYQSVMVVYALFMVVFQLRFFQTAVSNFAFVTVIGLTVNTACIALVVLFLVREKMTDRILSAILRFLHRVRLCKDPQARYKAITGQLRLFHDAAYVMGRSARLYFSAGSVTVLQITIGSLIPYFIYRSFRLRGISVTTMAAAQVFTTMASSFVPLPGSAGGAELGFYSFFRLFFGSSILPALLLWRILTYYLNILFGGVFAFAGSRRGKTDEKSRACNRPG